MCPNCQKCDHDHSLSRYFITLSQYSWVWCGSQNKLFVKLMATPIDSQAATKSYWLFLTAAFKFNSHPMQWEPCSSDISQRKSRDIRNFAPRPTSLGSPLTIIRITFQASCVKDKPPTVKTKTCTIWLSLFMLLCVLQLDEVFHLALLDGQGYKL